MNIQDFQHRTKFRLWFDKDKRWIHGPHERNDLDGVNLFGETIILGAFMDGISIEDLNDCVSLQFTGIRDKNGKDIFEGDIVAATVNQAYGHWGENLPPNWITRHFVVIYDETQASYQSRYIDWFRTCAGSDDGKPVGGLLSQRTASQEWEVIGNVFDNPELLSLPDKTEYPKKCKESTVNTEEI